MQYSKIHLPLLASLILLLSGCATKENLLCLVEFGTAEQREDISLLDSESTPTPPAELLPEPVEAETCIAQELDALKRTGSWGTNTEPPVEEIQKYDFPVVVNKQVEMYLQLFQGRQKKYFKRWLARSGRYMPLIHRELEKAGLPKDLAYLAMIESGFNQRAYSRARAVGMWQFMRATGRDYHLQVDSYVDERRDALKSTQAAVAYLKDLYQMFGDWHLAVAAYNGGPGKIGNGLKRYKADSFWKLAEKRYLRLETKRYVPKLIAAIIIGKEPEKYGFENIVYEKPMQYDSIEVVPGMSIDALALITGGSKSELRLLNQELKTDKTPLNRSDYIANIPKGSGSLAKKNMSRLHSVVKTGYKTHITKQNETLAAICKKYKINTTTLLKVNNLRSGKLRQGQRLRIPYSLVDYMLLPENGSAIAHARDSLVLHTIKRGETISKIATKYSVPRELIAEWNGLKNIHSIRAGQRLALYIVDHGSETTGTGGKKARANRATGNPIVLAETKKILSVDTDGKNSFSWYRVRSGDTLWKISRRFNTSPKMIKAWNNLESNLIHPGSELKLKDV